MGRCNGISRLGELGSLVFSDLRFTRETINIWRAARLHKHLNLSRKGMNTEERYHHWEAFVMTKFEDTAEIQAVPKCMLRFHSIMKRPEMIR